jgi:hypothetical protein
MAGTAARIKPFGVAHYRAPSTCDDASVEAQPIVMVAWVSTEAYRASGSDPLAIPTRRFAKGTQLDLGDASCSQSGAAFSHRNLLRSSGRFSMILVAIQSAIPGLDLRDSGSD